MLLDNLSFVLNYSRNGDCPLDWTSNIMLYTKYKNIQSGTNYALKILNCTRAAWALTDERYYDIVLFRLPAT